MRFIISLLLLVICLGPAWPQTIARDPTRLSVGGRILSLGKAFVGLSDDIGAIYTNPAGLGNLERWELTSMSGTFMEDFYYLNLSAGYPTKFGVFGIGFTNSSIQGGYATRKKEGSSSSDPVYEIDPTQPTIGYYNNVFILSYGNKLQPKILWGSNLKLFFSGLSGDGITQGDAQGYELDLGLLFKPKPWLSIGSTLQNALPASFGGKLTYASGHTESYPIVLENGLAIKILGEVDALRSAGLHALKLLLDFDYFPTRKNFPIIYHSGLEWSPLKLISIRVGIDQNASGNGYGTGMTAVSEFTAGVGINLSGFRFDYAYHEFGGAPGLSNNFFSLSYQPLPLPTPSKKPEIKIIKEIPKTEIIKEAPKIEMIKIKKSPKIKKSLGVKKHPKVKKDKIKRKNR